MPMSRDSASENTAGRRLRAILSRLSPLFSRAQSPLGLLPISPGKRSHLGQRRALRLSALLAPRNRLRLGAAAGAVILAGALIGSFALRQPAALPLNNAIWLDRNWTFGDIESDRLRELTGQLLDNQIGTAYAYVSSLGMDNRWSGGAQGKGNFMDSRPLVADFARQFKGQNEKLRVYGWIEIWTHLDNVDGYRLDDTSLHSNVADFSRLLVEQLGFDGVLLDVKPLFGDSDDLIRLVQRVRAVVGPDAPIAVAATADLTPPDARLLNLESIAPGTMWSTSFKKRVMESADEVVLLLYQSYRQEALDYVNWVAYHVETYLNAVESTTKILVSVPNYGGASSAHNPAVETLDRALDGVGEGLRRLDEEKHSLLTGIAVFSDEQLGQAEWKAFRELWLQR